MTDALARALLVTALALGLGGIASRAEAAEREPDGRIPLAYVRSLVAVPVILATQDDPAPPQEPSAAKKKEHAQWLARMKAREEFSGLRKLGRDALDLELSERLRQVRGITLTRASAALTENGRAPVADTNFVRLITSRNGADACLITRIDHFNRNTGLEREIWLRAVGWLWRADEQGGMDSARGPFFAIGRAVAGRRLLRGGFSKTDDELVRQAATQAAQRLSGELETGRTPLFMDDCRVAVLPAVIPLSLDKTVEAAPDDSAPAGRPPQSFTLTLGSLVRQRDVLFQPETSPTAIRVGVDESLLAMTSAGLQASDIWTARGAPDLELLARIADVTNARYVFASRIRDISLTDSPELAKDAGELRTAVRRQADVEVEGLLYGAREKALIWRDTVEGGTIAITEYVRHQPRLRSDEQCLADAARTAYAHLRSSFDEYKRRYDRDTVTAGRKQ